MSLSEGKLSLSAELKGPRELLRIRPGIFDFEPDLVLKLEQTKPKTTENKNLLASLELVPPPSGSPTPGPQRASKRRVSEVGVWDALGSPPGPWETQGGRGEKLGEGGKT